MSSTKEQVQKAAMGSFRTKEVPIGNTKVILRELGKSERDALDKSNYKVKPEGGFAEDEKGFLIPINPEHYMERWIAATIDPSFTVEEISEWPVSLKRTLCDEAKKVNNIESADTVAKNS